MRAIARRLAGWGGLLLAAAASQAAEFPAPTPGERVARDFRFHSGLGTTAQARFDVEPLRPLLQSAPKRAM